MKKTIFIVLLFVFILFTGGFSPLNQALNSFAEGLFNGLCLQLKINDLKTILIAKIISLIVFLTLGTFEIFLTKKATDKTKKIIYIAVTIVSYVISFGLIYSL